MRGLFKLLLVLSFILSARPGVAQRHIRVKRFYGGLELGLGQLRLSQNDVPTPRSSRFALGFYGGYTPFRWLRTGINLGGWLIEPYGSFDKDPDNGISISNSYLQVEVFPFRQSDFFINLSGGISQYINRHPNFLSANGTGGKAGIGYEHDFGGIVALSLVMNYGFGQFEDVEFKPISQFHQRYNVLEVLIGITAR